MISIGKDIKKAPARRGLFYCRQRLHGAFTFNFGSNAQNGDRTVVIGAFFAGFNFKSVARAGKGTIDISLALTFFVARSGEEAKQQTHCADA